MIDSGSKSSDQTRLSLVARAAQREDAAWRALVELYGPLMAEWCRRFGLDRHSSADCVQEAFASVAAKLHDFQHPTTSGAFRGWLWTITRNKLRDHCRDRQDQAVAAGGSSAQQRLNAVPDDYSLDGDDPTDDVQLAQLLQRAIVQVQAEFEPRSWQAFWRSAIDAIPTEVVAAELGVSPASVRQSRSRILRRLRQQLGDCP